MAHKKKQPITEGRSMRSVLSTIIVLLFMSQIVVAQPVAERILPERGYLAGASVKVIILVSETTTDCTLIDIPPDGWKASSIIYGGDFMDGQIKFFLRELSKPRTITYVVSPPESAKGEYSFSGQIEGNEIGGMRTIHPMIIEPVGIFDNHIDLGVVAYGKTDYNKQTDEYRIEVGLTADDTYHAHFLYKEVYGDCSIQVHAISQSPFSSMSSVALGIYDNLTIDSWWFGIETKVSGESWYGWGRGMSILQKAEPVAWPPFFDGRIRIERRGNVMSASYFDTEHEKWILAVENTMEFEDPVYIGMQANCAHGEYNVGTFSDVELTYDSQTSVANWEIH